MDRVICIFFGTFFVPVQSLLNIESVYATKIEMEALRQTVDSLKTSLDKAVAFVAELTHSIVNPANLLHIVFDNPKLNLGKAYNPRHGTFVAPFPGVHHFAVEISAPPEPSGTHGLHVRIMKNGQAVAITFLDRNTQQFLRRTGSIILQLDEGDDVWCQTDLASGPNEIYGGDTYSMFSGFLIKAL